MARSLLVVPASPWAGLASTCLGLVRALDRRGVRVAFVKPVAQPRDSGDVDRSAALIAAVSALRPPDPVPAAEVEQELSDGGLDAVLEKIVAAWQPVYDQSEVVVIEAVSPGPARLYAAEFNRALAQALDADVVLAGRWPPAADAGPAVAGEGPADAAGSTDGLVGGAVAQVAQSLAITAGGYQPGENARVVGCVVHDVPASGPEPRTVQAAVACAERGIARSVLLGPPDQVTGVVRSLGLRLPEGIIVTDPAAIAGRYVTQLATLRRHRGWTEDMAREHLADPITVGTMMLWAGEVDGLVAGAGHTTAATVRPALQILGTKPGSRLVSSVFFMCLPDEVVVYGDCAINPQPSAEDLADIALQSAASARAFGIEPRVAMISFSTGTSGAGSDVDKVAEATRLVAERAPGLAVDGPLQYDAAVIASVGQAKRPGSTVAGRASVFIFPDLDTGNTTYKAVQRSAHVVSIGPMLQGLAKPVNDLSRGALVDDVIFTIALTAVQSHAS